MMYVASQIDHELVHNGRKLGRLSGPAPGARPFVGVQQDLSQADDSGSDLDGFIFATEFQSLLQQRTGKAEVGELGAAVGSEDDIHR